MSSLRLPPLPTIRDILKLYKLSAQKRLSQNFLLDENLTDKIIRKSKIFPDSHVIEVGPGPGGLTRSIIRRSPKTLTVIEKDPRFKPTLDMLAEAFALTGRQMNILYEDILNINLSNILPEDEKTSWEGPPPNIHVIGNLPFNISTHLIIRWLQAISEQSGIWTYGRTKMTLTFQKEVAERLVARDNEEQRCRLSVMAQTWTFPVLRFVIPGTAFLPKPEVDVGVVTFTPLKNPHTKHDFKVFEKVTRHMFIYRQKYSIRCAETLFPAYCREELAAILFQLSDLDPTTRPYQLTVEEINRICTNYNYLIKKHPEIADFEYQTSRRILPLRYTGEVLVEDFVEPPIDGEKVILEGMTS